MEIKRTELYLLFFYYFVEQHPLYRMIPTNFGEAIIQLANELSITCTVDNK